MNSIVMNKTWEWVQLLSGKRIIGCKWVYAKMKGRPEDDNVGFKARVVVKGYAQKEGIDFNEYFLLCEAFIYLYFVGLCCMIS